MHVRREELVGGFIAFPSNHKNKSENKRLLRVRNKKFKKRSIKNEIHMIFETKYLILDPFVLIYFFSLTLCELDFNFCIELGMEKLYRVIKGLTPNRMYKEDLVSLLSAPPKIDGTVPTETHILYAHKAPKATTGSKSIVSAEGTQNTNVTAE